MPSHCVPVVANGVVVGFACTRAPRQTCSTPGCSGVGSQLCDYPVKRGGQAGTCDRRVCKSCAVKVGPNKDYCAAHARASASQPGAIK